MMKPVEWNLVLFLWSTTVRAPGTGPVAAADAVPAISAALPSYPSLRPPSHLLRPSSSSTSSFSVYDEGSVQP
jgi:hypothetical protein